MKHLLKIFSPYLLGLILFSMPAYAQFEEVELDREKSREMALDYSRDVKLAENKKQQALLQERIAGAALLPEFSASGLYLYSFDPIDVSIAPAELLDLEDPFHELINAIFPDLSLEIGLEGVTLAGVELEQAVYAGGRIRTARRMAKKGTEVAGLDIELNTAQVIALSDAAFFQYLSVKEKKQAALQYRELLDELVATLEDSVEEGLATRNELLKARVKQSEAILQVQQARSGLELARMNLCRITGMELETPISVTETLDPAPVDIDQLRQHNNNPRQRPEYRMLEKAIEIGNYKEKIAKGALLPELGFRAGYNYFGGVEVGGQTSDNMGFSMMAMLRVPIFNWNQSRNELSKARLQKEAARLEKDDATRLMQLEIARERFRLEDAFTRMNLTETALQHAEENLETSQDKYREGKETLTDLLEAQAQWQAAKSDHIQAQTSVELQKTLYLKAKGQLVEQHQ